MGGHDRPCPVFDILQPGRSSRACAWQEPGCPIEKAYCLPQVTPEGMKNNPAGNSRHQYAAFLRGINVGGRTIIKMEDLRKTFEALGFTGVKTVLASGNVIFDAEEEDLAALSRTIAGRLSEMLGRDIIVIVRPMEDLRELVARHPFDGIDITPETRLFVTFLSERAEGRDTPGESVSNGYRILSVSDGIVYSTLEGISGFGGAELMGAMEKKYGKKLTTRTWETIVKVIRVIDK